MPVYRFCVLPDGIDNVQLSFADDEAALEAARRALGDLAADAAVKGRPIPVAVEVMRDGYLLRTIVADDVI